MEKQGDKVAWKSRGTIKHGKAVGGGGEHCDMGKQGDNVYGKAEGQ